MQAVLRDASSNDPGRWQDWIAAWESYLRVAKNRAERTVRQYRRSVVNFLADTMLDPWEVTEDVVVRYLATVTPKAGARNNSIRALRSFYSWAVGSGKLEHDPAGRVTPQRVKYPEVPSLDQDELVRLFLAGWRAEPRQGLGIVFGYVTGGRLESLCAVEPTDVHLGKSPRVLFRVAKGNRPYVAHLGPLGVYVVEQLLDLMQPEQRTLLGAAPGTYWQWVHRAGMDAGIHAWPHLLRHTFGSDIPESTDPRVWMEMMNHADLSQYRRYRHPQEQQLRVAAAHF